VCRDLLFLVSRILVFVAAAAAAAELMNVKPARKKTALRQVKLFAESRKRWMTFSSEVGESVYLLEVEGCYDEEFAQDVENWKCTALAKMPTLA